MRISIGALIDAADALFRRDTIESIAEATQLYLRAHDLLGAKPASGVLSETETGYRTIVTDRLEKIRNSRGIDGVERARPHFEAPLDPALLIRARDVPDPRSSLS